MKLKTVTTALLVIAASVLLVTLALRVRTGASTDGPGKEYTAAKRCCGGNCAATSRNRGE